MANRDTPYGAFNFVVTFEGGDTFGGFSDVSGIGTEITVAEYRNGDEKENHVRKVPGVHKVSDVTLKRGIIGSLGLYQWIDQIRNGDPAGLRNVVIQLQNEDHTAIVMTWKLLRARIIKHTSGPLNGKGTDVAMEEITLAYERLELE